MKGTVFGLTVRVLARHQFACVQVFYLHSEGSVVTSVKWVSLIIVPAS